MGNVVIECFLINIVDAYKVDVWCFLVNVVSMSTSGVEYFIIHFVNIAKVDVGSSLVNVVLMARCFLKYVISIVKDEFGCFLSMATDCVRCFIINVLRMANVNVV